MNGHGLRTRILLFSMIPVFIIGCTMTAFFSVKNYTELNENLMTKGSYIASPLSTSLSFALNQKNITLVQGLINESARDNARNILAIAVFDKENKMLATSSIAPEISLFQLNPKEDEFIYTSTSTEYTDDGLIIRIPIYSYDAKNLLTLYNTTITKDESIINNSDVVFANPKLNYPRPIAGYLCIYLLKGQTIIDVYTEISIAVILLLLGLLISVIFGINLNRIIIDPINKLSSVIYEIREGNVNTKVNGVMYGELERLRSYINSMASTMAEFHNEMQFSVDTATNDLRKTLDKLSTQNKELELANTKAEEAATIKNDFLANMSHELRTPLNGIIGFAQQLYKSKLNNDQFEYLSTIERSAKNLLSIVNNILDFTKLESSKLNLECIPFSLRKVCYDTIKLLSTQAHLKGIELTVTVDPLIHDLILGDPIRLEQILTNLLGNSLKFTHQGNVALDISIKEHNNISFNKIDLLFKIKDTGIGISADQQSQLFTPFTQADSSISRKYGGTGLGLVITKHLIEQMDGNISLSSTVGQGTTFSFNIVVTKGLASVENTKNTSNKLYNKKIAIVEVNTWVRNSLCSLVDEWEMQAIPMSNLQPINSLANKNDLDYILIGLQKDYDFNHLIYDFNNLPSTSVKRIIFAINTLDPDPKLLDLSPISSIISKPVFPNKLYEALTNTSITKQQLSYDNNYCLPQNINSNINKDNLIKATILAVDDNDANLLLIKSLLSEIVTDVYVASTGQEAIERCLHTEFDLIFMDIQMPILDGLTTMKLIKENVTNKSTPVIAVTALVIKEEQERFIKEGMSEFLAKPLEENQLLALVQKYCNHKIVTPPIIQMPITKEDTEIWNIENALKQTGGRKTLALDMLNLFIQTLPQIELDIKNRDNFKPLELAAIIHKFAGGSVYCGITKIKKLCNIIETGLRNKGNVEEYEPEFLELEDVINIINKSHNNWIEKLKENIN